MQCPLTSLDCLSCEEKCLLIDSLDDHEAKALKVWCDIADSLAEEYSSDQVRTCVSAIATALREERQAGAAKWMLAQQALNRIDDAFEYRLGDDKSRAFIHGVLADYTAAIRARGETENG